MIDDTATVSSARADVLALARAASDVRDALDALPVCPLCAADLSEHAGDCPVLALDTAIREVVT